MYMCFAEFTCVCIRHNLQAKSRLFFLFSNELLLQPKDLRLTLNGNKYFATAPSITEKTEKDFSYCIGTV